MKQNYVADFEAITTPPVRVWLWSACNIATEKLHNGYDIDSFMEWVRTKDNIYFHNLKYDGSFIVYWLLQNGYRFSRSRKFDSFDTLISAQNVWYCVRVWFGDHKVVFYDSLKKIPLSVRDIPKAFGIEESKGEIDYYKERGPDYKPTLEEIEYCNTDCRIVAKAIKIMHDEGQSRMTVGSNALYNYRKTVTNFAELFPVLTLEDDAKIRKAYKGGYTYLKPEYAGKDIGAGIVLDVVSLYPSVMRTRILPVGEPIPFDGEPIKTKTYPLYVVRFKCWFIVKPDHLPTIQLKHSRFNETEYITDSDGPEFLTLTNVDFELFLEHYDIIDDIEFIGGYYFMGKTGIFDAYIDYWIQIKQTSTGGKRTLAKLMLNSLYGKFAKNPDVTQRYPTMEDDVLKFVRETEQYEDGLYIPMGAFITSYARDQTIRAAQQLYDRFVYSDTDSLHLTGYAKPDILIGDTLGKWAIEHTFERARFIRAKRYIQTVNGRDIVKCAGLPEGVKNGNVVLPDWYVVPEGEFTKVTWENFNVGVVYHGKLRHKQTKGGAVLVPTTFRMV